MNDVNALSFEQAYAELEAVVRQIEAPDLPLEESVHLYEWGQKLAQHCQVLLNQAELRLQKLNDNGDVVPIDHE